MQHTQAYTYSVFKMQLHSVNKLASVLTLKPHYPPKLSRAAMVGQDST
jgi:hypothetical protein